jgi:site-specific DNA-cytosine methylase
MESHGKLIKPILHELIAWTPLKEGITLLELFGGIGIGLKTLLQSRMVVRRYFYVNIDLITKQVVASRMMELTTRFPQQFSTTAWKASFTFLPSNIQLIQKKHTELLGPVDLIILGWECQGFLAARFGEGLSDTRSDLFINMVLLITWAQSISPTFNYVIENTFFNLTKGRKSRSTTRWSSITLESPSFLMRHNAIPMCTSYTISGPT